MTSLLVVEDDEAIAVVLAYRLHEAGYDTVVARDGVEALERLQGGAFDLVILDLMLPRLSGVDVLRMTRTRSNVPVIVLSARDGDADQVAALDLGADDYVTKPFSVRQLLARVSALLRRSAGAAVSGSAPGACEIVIDAGRHEVYRHGSLVPLAPREFELLVYLARHAGQVCSRDDALNAVWGYAYAGETRTVDVHVHWLRRSSRTTPRVLAPSSRCASTDTGSWRSARTARAAFSSTMTMRVARPRALNRALTARRYRGGVAGE
ncbi:MAG: response regulator transcription factor [Dehalococcoidia bacterium]